MADVDFPTILRTSPEIFNQKFVRAKLISKSETGRIYSAAKHEGGVWEFMLGWPESWALPDADYATLITFFNTYPSTLFNWTHIKTGVVYECLFLDDDLPEAKPIYGHWILTGLRIGQSTPG